MSKRFFVGEPIGDGCSSTVKLADQEAHHLTHVMRAQVNDEVVLFDGTGIEYDARVEKLEKRAVWLEIIARKGVSREPSVRLSIGVALPKGDRQQWLCEKLVELGCHALTPLHTERGVAEPGEAALARLRRFVVEASKQCGRNRLMEIGEPCTAAEYFASATAETQRLVLDAAGEPLSIADNTPQRSDWQATIGPEGGWTQHELSVARENAWEIVSLGSRILRVETAAIAICSRICVD